MKALIEHMAQALVDHPEEVSVEEVDKRGVVAVELRVAPDDLGKVIGRRGRTAAAMRALLAASASKQNRRVILEILE